jgi:membrane-bound ClpP family serine protease
MPNYYDLVLGLIPLSLAGLTALFLLGGLSMSLSVPLASIAAIGVIGHAMFVNGPATAGPPRSTDAHAGGGHQPAD